MKVESDETPMAERAAQEALCSKEGPDNHPGTGYANAMRICAAQLLAHPIAQQAKREVPDEMLARALYSWGTSNGERRYRMRAALEAALNV